MAGRASLEPKEHIKRGGQKQWRLNVPHHLSPTGQSQRLYFDTREQARAHVRKLKGESGTGQTVADQQAIDAALE